MSFYSFLCYVTLHNIDCSSFKLRGSPSWASFFVCNYWCLTFCSRLPATSKIMFLPPRKNNTTHIPTSPARIENTRYSFTSWIWCTTASSAHASYEGYGCNKTKPPRSPHRNTMIDVGVFGCGPSRMGDGAAAPFNGCIFWSKFGRRGDLIPWPNRDGRTKLDHLSLSKKSTIPQSTVGGLFMFSESAVGRNGGPVCGDGNYGEYSTLGGGGRHGQLVTGRSISMVLPALTP
jgi:hypothetical protein